MEMHSGNKTRRKTSDEYLRGVVLGSQPTPLKCSWQSSLPYALIFQRHVESVSELMIVKKKQLQQTVRRTVLLGCFYLLYML